MRVADEMRPSFYLDEDVSPVYAVELEKIGCEVSTATQSDRTGKSDADQLAYSIERGAVLITHNVKDFGKLSKLVLASGGHHPGIIGIHQLDRRGRPRRLNEAVRKLTEYVENKDSDELRDTFQVI